ncbi:MAG: hypothetical protein ACI86M_001063 [Saprospiraceae bacterium]|jgi:hypothetical protein
MDGLFYQFLKPPKKYEGSIKLVIDPSIFQYHNNKMCNTFNLIL